MHFLYCDETNLEERRGDFLIYGGIMIDGAAAHDLSRRIDEIRRMNGIDRAFHLKFNPGPTGMAHNHFIEVKQEIIETAAAHNVRLLTYLVLHDIADDPDTARRFGINSVCYHFDCMLNRLNDAGFVLIDQFTDEGNQIEAHLREKFSVGVRGMPYSMIMHLDRILGFHYSAIGQSHFPSLIDIILGSFRFAVNRHTRCMDEREATAQRLLRLLSPLFIRQADGKVSELSLLFSPKQIKVERYRDTYQALKDYLTASGIESEQTITEFRMY